MSRELTKEEQLIQEKLDKNYEKFMAGLQKLSKKYGFAISACGCFYWDADGFQDIEYRVDRSSCDIRIDKLIYSDGEVF